MVVIAKSWQEYKTITMLEKLEHTHDNMTNTHINDLCKKYTVPKSVCAQDVGGCFDMRHQAHGLSSLPLWPSQGVKIMTNNTVNQDWNKPNSEELSPTTLGS